MRLTVDLVPSEAMARRRSYAALFLGLVVFASGLFYYSLTSQQLEQKQAEVEQLTRELDQLLRKAENSRDPVREASERQRAQTQKYRETFPWNDLFDALESLQPLQVKDFFATADEGRASLELVGPDPSAILVGVETLTKALPEWDVRLRAMATGKSDTSASIELHDRQKPR